LAIICGGCGPRFDWEGVWEGERAVDAVSHADPAVLDSLRRVRLTLKGSRFDLFDRGLPHEGEWSGGSDAATLYVKSTMRQPASGTRFLRVRSAEEIEYRDGTDEVVVLRRVATSETGRP
jgi:hypothetical protein